jgi:hypothetical protein
MTSHKMFQEQLLAALSCLSENGLGQPNAFTELQLAKIKSNLDILLIVLDVPDAACLKDIAQRIDDASVRTNKARLVVLLNELYSECTSRSIDWPFQASNDSVWVKADSAEHISRPLSRVEKGSLMEFIEIHKEQGSFVRLKDLHDFYRSIEKPRLSLDSFEGKSFRSYRSETAPRSRHSTVATLRSSYGDCVQRTITKPKFIVGKASGVADVDLPIELSYATQIEVGAVLKELSVVEQPSSKPNWAIKLRERCQIKDTTIIRVGSCFLECRSRLSLSHEEVQSDEDLGAGKTGRDAGDLAINVIENLHHQSLVIKPHRRAIVGRDPNAKVRVSCHLVSSNHGEFIYEEHSGWTYTDLGSKNSSWKMLHTKESAMSGKASKAHWMTEEDVLSIGTYTLTLA